MKIKMKCGKCHVEMVDVYPGAFNKDLWCPECGHYVTIDSNHPTNSKDGISNENNKITETDFYRPKHYRGDADR